MSLTFGLGVVVLYWIVSPLGFALQKQIPVLSALHWNWLGKVLAIAATLTYWRITRLFAHQIGLKWRHRDGPAVPAFAVIALFCAFS